MRAPARPPDPEKTNPPTPDSLAAEGEGGRDRNLAARLGRYGTAKARSHQMAGYLLKAKQPELSHKVYQCGSYLHFREWANHDRTTLHQGYFCQVPLLCPLCAIRRGGKMLRRYVERAEYLARDHDLHFVTLTVKNGDDLAERFAHLKASMRKLRERAKKGYGAFAQAKGALWSFEFTKSGHGWHPHVHMVWAVPKGSDPIAWGKESQLGRDWLDITGDSFITHARPVLAGDGGGLIDAFCEVLKYALKFSTLNLADNYEAFTTLRKRRLVSSSGVWWGLELPDDAKLADDPLDGPFIEHVYRWAGTRGYVLDDAWLGEQPSHVTTPARGPTPGLPDAPKEAYDPPPGGGEDAHSRQAVGADQDHAQRGSARASARSRAPARPGTGDALLNVGRREGPPLRGAGRGHHLDAGQDARAAHAAATRGSGPAAPPG